MILLVSQQQQSAPSGSRDHTYKRPRHSSGQTKIWFGPSLNAMLRSNSVNMMSTDEARRLGYRRGRSISSLPVPRNAWCSLCGIRVVLTNVGTTRGRF